MNMNRTSTTAHGGRRTTASRFFRWLAYSWSLAVLLAAPQTYAIGSEAEVTTNLVGTCVACHGADGIGKAPQYPSLRGQPVAYLKKQLEGFRSGRRKSSSMNVLARNLSDTDIAVLAGFFGNLTGREVKQE